MRIYNCDREKSIKLFDDYEQLKGLEYGNHFKIKAHKNDYHVVQLLLTEVEGKLDIEVLNFNDLARVTVFNTEGIDKYGKKFSRSCILKKDRINPIFIGVELDGLENGKYSLSLKINKESIIIDIDICLNEVGEDRYKNLKNLARLNWLNSDKYLDNTVVKPFIPIQFDGNTAKILGRNILFDKSLQIKNAISQFDMEVQLSDNEYPLLSDCIKFDIGEEVSYGTPIINNNGNSATLKVDGESESFFISTNIVFNCEGMLDYKIFVTAKRDINTNILLRVPYSKNASVYSFGLGKKGGKIQPIENFKWNDKRHDCMMIGNINVGARIKLMAEEYRNPLVNIYYNNLPILKPETTWDNYGKGSINVYYHDEKATLEAKTGEIFFKQGECKVFRYDILLTPFKPVDFAKNYKYRYYQNYNIHDGEYRHLRIANRAKLNVFNVHHGNGLHPYINYPFFEIDRLKKFLKKAKEKGFKVKLYYTCREMSNHTSELWVYKSLDDEIIMQKKGQGLDMFNKRDWLNKYLSDGYIPAWQVHYYNGSHKGDDDIAFIITPDSRLDNYYIEGLDWLVKNLGIDGIYIDDTSLDHTTIRRARKILDKVDGLIDMHMSNHEDIRNGDCACANIYADIFPFMDSLWVGEGFNCKKLDADYILTEVSGLMYGNTSQMLDSGGDLYCGMLYSMSNRYGWGVWNTTKIHKLWDNFEISKSRLLGYWNDKNPIKTNNKNVKVSSYIKKDSILVCVYNFSEQKQKFDFVLNNDLEKMINKSKVHKLFLKDYLSKKRISIFKSNTLKARDGVILEITM